MLKTKGIHHITAIVGDPQENIDFYANVLGLRLVKKTVNFDDPGTYHLYFGNELGQPGTILTFFPWAGAFKGRSGTGLVGTITFVVPAGALDFWANRLEQLDLPFGKATRFGETFLQFEDPHGLQLELVARQEGANSKWTFDSITSDVAIKGFGGAVLLSGAPHQTVQLLEEVMGLENVGKERDYHRLHANGDLGNVIDVKLTANPRAVMGTGTVHHIAWRTNDDAEQKEWQQHLHDNGYYPTDVKDRQYFNAIYFREAGGILFEIATDPPGFVTDETPEHLGEKLLLPPWLEVHREKIEGVLQPVETKK